MSQDRGAVETKVENPTVPQAATDETNKPVTNDTADDTATDEAGSQETNTPVIDYEAELRRVEAERDNYKQGLLDAKDKLKRRVSKEEPSEEGASDDDQSAVEIIRQAVAAEVAPLRKELVSNSVSELLGKLTNNPAEQKLTLFHYENTINKTGISREAVLKDLENALAIANAKRLQKERDEAILSVKNRAGLQNNSMGSNQSPAGAQVDVSNLKFSPMEMNIIQRNAAREKITVDDYIKKHLPDLKS